MPKLLRCRPACRTARPAIFIVKPGLQAQFFGGVRAAIDEVKPFVAEVFSGEPGARMHEDPAHAHFLEDRELAKQLLFGQFAIPAPEWFSAKGVGGIFPGVECGENRGNGRRIHRIKRGM